MTTENQPFEDACPIEIRDLPLLRSTIQQFSTEIHPKPVATQQASLFLLHSQATSAAKCHVGLKPSSSRVNPKLIVPIFHGLSWSKPLGPKRLKQTPIELQDPQGKYDKGTKGPSWKQPQHPVNWHRILGGVIGSLTPPPNLHPLKNHQLFWKVSTQEGQRTHLERRFMWWSGYMVTFTSLNWLRKKCKPSQWGNKSLKWSGNHPVNSYECQSNRI